LKGHFYGLGVTFLFMRVSTEPVVFKKQYSYQISANHRVYH